MSCDFTNLVPFRLPEKSLSQRSAGNVRAMCAPALWPCMRDPQRMSVEIRFVTQPVRALNDYERYIKNNGRTI